MLGSYTLSMVRAHYQGLSSHFVNFVRISGAASQESFSEEKCLPPFHSLCHGLGMAVGHSPREGQVDRDWKGTGAFQSSAWTNSLGETWTLHGRAPDEVERYGSNGAGLSKRHSGSVGSSPEKAAASTIKKKFRDWLGQEVQLSVENSQCQAGQTTRAGG